MVNLITLLAMLAASFAAGYGLRAFMSTRRRRRVRRNRFYVH